MRALPTSRSSPPLYEERRATLPELGFLARAAATGASSEPVHLAELRWPVPDPVAAAGRYRELARLLGAPWGSPRGPAVSLGPAVLRPVPQGSAPEVHSGARVVRARPT
ncbi:hypothetical protein [Limnochorda pilosa]|uniref:Uncharacterized protein n=1 Tax=Limnochorda pilosa TaxID=1555112 RepID=A0A0K2SIG6_LIMPI|nr:hypothetical protein [Limnochorda pilosa]BAS26880.1 hypothetical protein LIP_1023 [Limnochorda pilosa]